MAGIKSDAWIRRMALEHRMIDPFEDRQVRSGVVSYGLSSYGYDIRVADEFKVFTNINSTVIDPKNFVNSIRDHFGLVLAIIGALLVGKWIAASIAARLFRYTPAARKTVWSLTLPQVAATLAATLVGYDTFNTAGDRLLDVNMLNVVFVLLLVTAILGPVLTERFAPEMLSEAAPPRRLKTAS